MTVAWLRPLLPCRAPVAGLFFVLAVSFMMATVGMIYELSLAQLISGILGQNLLRYQVALALFVFGLGCGALCAIFLRGSPLRSLVVVEFLLCLCGAALYPVGKFFLEIDAQVLAGSFFLQGLLHVPLILIAVLSGIELPLLLRLLVNRHGSVDGLVIASDCAGMVCACVLFPFCLLGPWGLWGVVRLALILNATAAVLTLLMCVGRSFSSLGARCHGT